MKSVLKWRAIGWRTDAEGKKKYHTWEASFNGYCGVCLISTRYGRKLDDSFTMQNYSDRHNDNKYHLYIPKFGVTKTFETKCMAQRHAENLFKTLQMLVLIPYHYTFKHIWDNYYWRGEIVLRTEQKQARDAHRAIKKITSEIEARIIGELPALIKSVELKDLRLKLINVLDDAGIARNLET